MESVEPGKAVWWLIPRAHETDHNVCDSCNEALDELVLAIKHTSAKEGVVNYKSPGGEYLDVVHIKKYRLPKRNRNWLSELFPRWF